VTELEKQLTETVHRQKQQIDLLQQKLEALIRLHFGQKSEKLDPTQLELLLGGLGEENLPGKPDESPGDVVAMGDEDFKPLRKKKNSERQPRIPDHLPVEEEVLLPDPVKACPEAWRQIGEEVSEQLDFQPGRFLKKRIIRPKYVKRSWRKQDHPPIIAQLPARLIEGGLPTAGLLAQVVTAKYCDHLPLYRQEQIYRQRHGIELPRQTNRRNASQIPRSRSWPNPTRLPLGSQSPRSTRRCQLPLASGSKPSLPQRHRAR